MRFNSFSSPSRLFLSLPLYLFILPTSTVSSSLNLPRFNPYFADIVKRQEHRNFSSIFNSPHNIALDTDVARNSLGAGGGDLHEARHELYRVVTEATPIHLALTLIPAFIVFFGLFSAFVKEKLYVGEAIIAVVFGIILGPMVLGLFDPRSWGGGEDFDHLTLELTRIVISLSVFAVGVELPKAYVLRHWRSLAVLLGPLMLIGWMISGLLIYVLIPGLDFLSSLLVAAACTPTDPILAASVVGKGKYAQKHVPAHLRHLLQAESGCNDGAAFPFLFLALFIALRGDYSLGKVVGEWILLVILYQIVLGTAIGAVIGIIARKTLKFCKRRSYIDRESMVAMYVALSLLTTGLTTLVGSDDLLAAFACGAAFAWDDWFTESIEASNFSSIIDLLINCATFIYVGATIPFKEWNDPSLTLVPWRIVILAFSVICLRRLPAMLLLQKLIPDIKTGREAVFSGHFGPIGVGAIFISTLAVTKLPTPNIPPQNSLDTLALTAQPLTYLFVLFSVLIHGLSIPFFTLGRNVSSRVHSISRTWTQASGNEPSWLNRVKRVDRNADGDAVDANGQRVPMPGETPPTPLNNDMDLEKQIGTPHVNLAQPLNPSTPTIDPLARPTSSPRPSYHSEPPPPEPAQRPPLPHTLRTSPHGLGNFANLSLARTSSLFKGARRTEQEEQARKEEKFRRDDWCRKERHDVPQKGEERIYRSGRHIIIERGDGDEVEVRDADPSTAAVEKAKTDPQLGLVFIPAGRLKAELKAVERDGVSTASRRLEAFKRIVKGGLKHHKDEGSVLPGPGQGPRSSHRDDTPEAHDATQEPRSMRQSGDTINPSSSHTHSAEAPDDQQSWIEGHKVRPQAHLFFILSGRHLRTILLFVDCC
ncbi:Sodium/hydrogen exchanger family-domain-containing protein [Melampsora americana]|nr:Sodium/hydrogen exchanger family-domain-containing protein [Melampsora americana]